MYVSNYIITRCSRGPQFIYPLGCWWIFGFVPVFCCHRHPNSYVHAGVSADNVGIQSPVTHFPVWLHFLILTSLSGRGMSMGTVPSFPVWFHCEVPHTTFTCSTSALDVVSQHLEGATLNPVSFPPSRFLCVALREVIRAFPRQSESIGTR